MSHIVIHKEINMNIFIFVDISNQFNSINKNLKPVLKSRDNFIVNRPQKNLTSLVGVGGFRNRRVIFMNRAAILNGIRYGECWNPSKHHNIICLSKREVAKANEILNAVSKFIESKFGPCDQREKGFFSFTISKLEDKILIKKLGKIQQEIELKFDIECSIGAAYDPMIARLSCLMSGKNPRITSRPLLKSLISQAPLEILGIPRKIEKILIDKSIYNSNLLRDLTISELREILDTKYQKYALDLFRIVRGIDPFNKQIKVPKKQLSYVIRFEEPISDPLTLYLSIENRWSEFIFFVHKYKVPISRLKCMLISPMRENENISIIDNKNGSLANRSSWRKELRDAIYNTQIVKPVLAVNLIAEYGQVAFQYDTVEQFTSTEKIQSNYSISGKVNISSIISKLRMNQNRVRNTSNERETWLSQQALKRKDQKQNDECIYQK